ncbi:hypothetical protein AAFF_G00253230 [Aldrovandia affinis]|uniref:Uncharacterized protein n=1 Tax=Aldrovandia affinis TaxID=143900 RepID=A0AAD7WTP2_9TELE|nr:hypothetical protein AAFF_G00253230 [Aldrovandia affinis]
MSLTAMVTGQVGRLVNFSVTQEPGLMSLMSPTGVPEGAGRGVQGRGDCLVAHTPAVDSAMPPNQGQPRGSGGGDSGLDLPTRCPTHSQEVTCQVRLVPPHVSVELTFLKRCWQTWHLLKLHQRVTAAMSTPETRAIRVERRLTRAVIIYLLSEARSFSLNHIARISMRFGHTPVFRMISCCAVKPATFSIIVIRKFCDASNVEISIV